MALTFGAASDRVDLAAGLNNENAFTVLAWLYKTGDTDGAPIWWKGTGNNKGFFLQYGAGGNDFGLYVMRATTNADSASVTGTLPSNEWSCVAGTYDETDGPRLFKGSLTSAITEVSYATRVVGAGTTTDDSGGVHKIGQRPANDRNFPGRIAIFAHFKRRLTLQEIVAWQFHPFVDADTDIFMELGYNGTGTQPNLTSLGNGINGTVTGATVGDHVPLPPRFGFDVPVIPVRAGVFGAASLGMVLGVVSSATRKTFGAASLPLVASIVSSGVRKTFSSASLGLLANIVSSAKATRFGAASASFVLNISSSVASGFRLTAVSESTLTLATESEDSSQSLTPKAEDSSLTLTALEEFS